MFRNKEYIYCVYKEQGFGKAAEKLHVSQPALSAMVKRIETQLGMPVFNRATSPISLTSFGVEYIKSIETVSALEGHLQKMTYELQALLSGHLYISAYNLSHDYLIPEMIAEFIRQYPQINVHVVGTNTIQSKQMLDSGEIDLFFSTRPMDKNEYKGYPIYREQLVLVVPKQYAINQEFQAISLTPKELSTIYKPSVSGVPLSSFREVPFILSNNENYLRSCTDTLFREAGFHPNIVLETDESGIGPNFARYGVGATISSHLLIARSDYKKHFFVYKLNSNYATRTGHIYHRKGVYITPAMTKFLDLSKTRFVEHESANQPLSNE